jgi:hypothetical protein
MPELLATVVGIHMRTCARLVPLATVEFNGTYVGFNTDAAGIMVDR